MGLFSKKDALSGEWKMILDKELRFLQKRQDKKENILNRKLEGKVPEKLEHTLHTAFAKAFTLIFEKGVAAIEKTYNRQEREEDSRINHYSVSVRRDKKALRSFSKKSRVDGAANLLVSGVSGVGMGLFGVGLPDIPLFTSLLLRSLYETALNYGYGYDSIEEQFFILLLIQGGVSSGEELLKTNERVNCFIEDGTLPALYEQREHIEETARMIAKELLYMKFLQGIPAVGAFGGAYDAVYMKRILEYGNLKYRQRFLHQMVRDRAVFETVEPVPHTTK